MTYHCYISSPIGRLHLVSNGQALTALHMEDEDHTVAPGPDWQLDENAAPFPVAREQLAAYFSGKPVDFDVPLAAAGTAFQQRVWALLREIPHGITTTYGDLAQRLGIPQGSRAVGLANGSNPIAVIVPCHRVIGANGKLTGYGGGLWRKQILLDLEAGRDVKPPEAAKMATAAT